VGLFVFTGGFCMKFNGKKDKKKDGKDGKKDGKKLFGKK
jgi:hypothetical protein